jgi:hypothetical protein
MWFPPEAGEGKTAAASRVKDKSRAETRKQENAEEWRQAAIFVRSDGSVIDGCISKNDGTECWNGCLAHAMMGGTAA